MTADVVLGGRYHLRRQLARGGMATVWEAEDRVLGRRVAVKVLHPHLARDPSFRERFRREGVAVARLTHPAVVAVYDTGADDELVYLVMELVEGRTLRDLLDERGPLDLATAVHLVTEVADGLASAHDRGIVHRDVKPGNVLMMPDGRAKITDFGIARGGAGSGSELDEDLTEVGTFVGTAKYVAPEQVEGGPVGPRTDVYALGLVLYEAICGRPAFDEEGDLATAVARTRRAPLAPRQLRVDIPRELEAVTMRALARDPDDRYPSARELRAALLSLELDDGEPTPETGLPLTVPDDRRFTAGVVAVLVVGLAAALLGVFFAGTGTGRSVLEQVRERLPGGEPEPRPTAVTGADDFDPFGNDGAEHPGEVGLAHDGDPETAWRTDNYHTPAFGNLKPGVGIHVSVEDQQELRRLVVTTRGESWNAEVYVAPEPSSSLEGWGTPIATGTELGERARFDLGGVAGGSVLLWITHLPASGQLEIVEIDVLA